MKVLVTGGSGYLGTHIRSHFGADDLSRRSGFDILDEDDCAIAAEYDLVIHLAANMDKSIDGEIDTFETNVIGTQNLLKAMSKDSCFIYMSTKDIYGRWADNYYDVPEICPTEFSGQSPLEWSKLIAESYVKYFANSRGFRSCIFRLSSAYGPNSEGNTPGFVGHFANAINFGERLRLPGGGVPVRDILHVNDLANACTAFVESVIRHGVYNVGGGRENALSMRELVVRLQAVSGLQVIIDEESPLPMPTPKNYVTDLSLIKTELDWEPKVHLDDGLKTLFR
jgi:CDP-paratose 2-epimerase